jgi:hypothetical protein
MTWLGLEARALAWLHRALAQAKALDFFFQYSGAEWYGESQINIHTELANIRNSREFSEIPQYR